MTRLSCKILLAGLWVTVALLLGETWGQASMRYQACSAMCKNDIPLRGGNRGGVVRPVRPTRVVTDPSGNGGNKGEWNGIIQNSETSGQTGRGLLDTVTTTAKNSTTTHIKEGVEGHYVGGDGKKIVVVQTSNQVNQGKFESTKIRWFG